MAVMAMATVRAMIAGISVGLVIGSGLGLGFGSGLGLGAEAVSPVVWVGL